LRSTLNHSLPNKLPLTTDQLKQLSHLYDRWQSGDAAARDAVQREIDAAEPEIKPAFAHMFAHAATDASAALLPPISPEMREAAVLAVGDSDSGAAGLRRSTQPSTGGDALHAAQAALFEAIRARAPGQLVGPYRLIKELGRGGMGVVWLAERADGQHSRQVALKMPLVENLNWLLAARFARERNILASLEHPGIARLYDAGVDQTTQPYIAIEYVDGLPITEYVRAHKLRADAVVVLFARVIEAVAHAHAQLVIHRDIKPSNILVDSKGEPHLLDFGIAKLLHDEDSPNADVTQLTKLSGRALTLDYASPEQVNSAPLGVASDVYALGVVLFELLTGSRPYHPNGPSRRDLELAILEQEPSKPSDHLLGTGDGASEKSARRMRGDLDTIVLKALRKDPKHRYGTAQAFADDLKRYLRYQPIKARPDGAVYRISKFMRRQRLPLVVALIGAVAVVGLSARAWQQQRVAQASVARADSIDGLMKSIFKGMSPSVAASRNFSTKELLDRAQNFVNEDRQLDVATRRAASVRIAGLYIEIGAFSEALAIFELERGYAASQGEGLAEAEALWSIANVSSKAGRFDAAKVAIAQLHDRVQKLSPASNEMTGKLELAEGNFALSDRRPSKAWAHFRAAETLFSGSSKAQLGWRAWALQGQGAAATDLSKTADARALLLRAHSLYGQAGAAHRVDQLQTEYLIAELDISTGHYAAALARLGAVLPDLEARVGSTDDYVLYTLQLVIKAQIRSGLAVDATRSLAKLMASNVRGDANVKKFFQFHTAHMQMYSGEAALAEQSFAERLRDADITAPRIQFLRRAHAEAMLRLDRNAEALATLLDIEDRQLKTTVAPDTDLALTRVLLSCALARTGALDAARGRAQLALAALVAGRGPDFPATLVAQSYLSLLNAGQAPDGAVSASQLADRVQRELGWQAGAKALQGWLRSHPIRETWSALPVVL
jgi:serine/threonine protein kinase